jgi:hypothetical protein
MLPANEDGRYLQTVGEPKKLGKSSSQPRCARNPSITAKAADIWQEHTGRIIIKHDQLKDLGSYAGTLLHEAHATSGATNITQESSMSSLNPSAQSRKIVSRTSTGAEIFSGLESSANSTVVGGNWPALRLSQFLYLRGSYLRTP